MSERRTPPSIKLRTGYTTATKPRQPWPGETAARYEPPANVPVPDYTMVSQHELDWLRQRITALEAAARSVVETYEREDELLLLFREIEALGRVLGER